MITASETNLATTLKEKWSRLRQANPKIRIRDAARELGVSEVELLATGCGRPNGTADVTRLRDPWPELIQELPKLGRVMALTRNEHAVHERKGIYRVVQFFGETMGNVLGPDIDLRLFLRHWHLGFAVRETTPHGARESLQFFDRDGTAVHKIYLEQESDRQAYARLVGTHLAEDQSEVQTIHFPAPKPTQTPDRLACHAGHA